jgi:hypothetical protein
VQVYFPGLGWLDFDTTVGNNEARESPTPDGTPPMQPPKAWLAADGVVVDVDTLKKTIQMTVHQFVFHDKDYKLPISFSLKMDMKVALVYRDSLTVPLYSIQKGDSATAVSYAESLKNLEPSQNDNGNTIIKRFPVPTPVDEIYLKRKDTEKPKENSLQQFKPRQTSLRTLLWESLGTVCAIILLLLLLPQIILLYYKAMYKLSSAGTTKSYWAFMAATYYLHMMGMPRSKKTPMQYARDVIDPALGTSLTGFMNIYLKKKYAKQPLNENEKHFVNEFLSQFLITVKTKIKLKRRFFALINPLRCAGYFMVPEDDEKEG